MPGGLKVLGSNLTATCFFFQTASYLSAYQLSASLSHLEVVFLAARIFLRLLLVFDLLLQFVIFFTLTLYSFVFFVLLKKFLGPNFFGFFLSTYWLDFGSFRTPVSTFQVGCMC